MRGVAFGPVSRLKSAQLARRLFRSPWRPTGAERWTCHHRNLAAVVVDKILGELSQELARGPEVGVVRALEEADPQI